ncbi:hypothetical protein LCGC14_2534080 [marine sediment metagenome]|uniref:Uncharacterized protein n=1 Tax=marine sediment metagenome TaxID=412755 RepID=A0A0F9D461_9ZZZZ
MPLNLDQMVLQAKLKALKHKQAFLEKWAESPSAFPQGGAVQTGQEQPFNQAENPAQGGLSIEGRVPGSSDR